MSRARINEADEDVVIPKSRVRKPRAVPLVDEDRVAPRKQAVSRARVASTVSSTPARKAPTPIATRRLNRSKNSKTIFVVLGMSILLVVIGVVIGVMDKGSIDVIAVVNDRNEKINKGEVRDDAGNTVSKTIQVQTGDIRPNGGLQIGEAVTPPVPPPELEVSTTTETVSTSTSEVISEVENTESTAEADTEASEAGV